MNEWTQPMTMTLNGKICNIVLKGSRLDQVDTRQVDAFRYLGSLHDNRRCGM